MTLREALTRAAGQLAAHPALRDSAVPDATLLLMHALSLARSTLLAHPERAITRDDQAVYQALLERRLRFEPMQYILGEQEFFGLALKVSPAVLIPRPETELLVDAVLARLRHDQQLRIQPLRIADVGTGSGAIAIALAHALPQAHVTALDVSSAALAIAGENAATHAVLLRFLESDLLHAVASESPFDAIVSNPPYIPTGDAPTLHPQVRDHEPPLALFAGDTGLDLYRRLIPQAHALLKPNGLLALEIGFGQQQPIASLLADWREVEFLPDLQGIPRVTIARRGPDLPTTN